MYFTMKQTNHTSCCLCGSTNDLTGEHKIKASAIRNEFGSEKMVIGHMKDPSTVRSVQGPKSKNLHFKSRICRACNSERTQGPDRTFVTFNEAARKLINDGQNPNDTLDKLGWDESSIEFLDTFRYFAKIMCCQIAQIEAPCPTGLSEFAIGRTSNNRIWLEVHSDWTFQQAFKQFGDHQYAAHGGLVIVGNKVTGKPTRFYTTMTVGPVQYIFFVNLNWLEQLELMICFPKQHKKWVEQTKDAAQNPMSLNEKLQLGYERDSDLDRDDNE